MCSGCELVCVVCFSKLQSDLKTTKVEEMKAQMEVFYQEIVRLQNSKDTGVDKAARYVQWVGGSMPVR